MPGLAITISIVLCIQYTPILHITLCTHARARKPYFYTQLNKKVSRSLLFSFLQSPFTSCLLEANTLLRTPFFITLSLCSSLNVADQRSRPYKTGKIVVLCIKILMYLLVDTKVDGTVEGSTLI